MTEKILELAQTAGYGSRWNTTQELEDFLERFAYLVHGLGYQEGYTAGNVEGYESGYQDGIDESCYND